MGKGLSKVGRLEPLGEILILRAARRALVKIERHPLDRDLVLDFSYAFLCLGQIRGEIAGLMEMVEALRPRAVLEIGTALGGTLFPLVRCAHTDATIISIDLPRGRYGGSYGDSRARLFESFRRPGQRLELLHADSHRRESLEFVEQRLAGQPLDVVFIDGDHSETGVQMDYEMYSPLLRPGGLLVLHDIVPGRWELVGGVPKFWQNIRRQRHDVIEFVESWEQGGFGIGVVKKAD